MATDAEINVAVETLDPDLHIVLAERVIDRDLQAKFVDNGIKSFS